MWDLESLIIFTKYNFGRMKHCELSLRDPENTASSILATSKRIKNLIRYTKNACRKEMRWYLESVLGDTKFNTVWGVFTVKKGKLKWCRFSVRTESAHGRSNIVSFVYSEKFNCYIASNRFIVDDVRLLNDFGEEVRALLNTIKSILEYYLENADTFYGQTIYSTYLKSIDKLEILNKYKGDNYGNYTIRKNQLIEQRFRRDNGWPWR